MKSTFVSVVLGLGLMGQSLSAFADGNVLTLAQAESQVHSSSAGRLIEIAISLGFVNGAPEYDLDSIVQADGTSIIVQDPNGEPLVAANGLCDLTKSWTTPSGGAAGGNLFFCIAK